MVCFPVHMLSHSQICKRKTFSIMCLQCMWEHSYTCMVITGETRNAYYDMWLLSNQWASEGGTAFPLGTPPSFNCCLVTLLVASALPLPTWSPTSNKVSGHYIQTGPHLAVYNAELDVKCKETLPLVMSLFPKLCWGLTRHRKRTGKSWVYRVTWKKCHLAPPDFTFQLGLFVTPHQVLRLLYWKEYWYYVCSL